MIFMIRCGSISSNGRNNTRALFGLRITPVRLMSISWRVLAGVGGDVEVALTLPAAGVAASVRRARWRLERVSGEGMIMDSCEAAFQDQCGQLRSVAFGNSHPLNSPSSPA